jgi:multidrug efflux pump subunit AcrB
VRERNPKNLKEKAKEKKKKKKKKKEEEEEERRKKKKKKKKKDIYNQVLRNPSSLSLSVFFLLLRFSAVVLSASPSSFAKQVNSRSYGVSHRIE